MFTLAAQQLLIMVILMAVGYLCFKIHFIKPETQKDFSNILVYIAMPSVIINVFQRPFSSEILRMLVWASIASASVYLISIAVAEFIFHERRIHHPEHRIALKFGTVFTNASFMGIPLAQALFGDDGVIFMVIHLLGYTIFQWTYGITLYRQSEDSLLSKLGKILLNPNLLGTFFGVILWLTSTTLPQIIGKPITYLANLNTPLSMLMIGSNIATIKFFKAFKNPKIWLGVLLSNLLIPLVMVAVLSLFPLSSTAYLALVLGVSCPVAGMVVIFAVLHDHHNEFPVQLMCVSTLLSVITIPTVLTLVKCWL